MHAKPNSARSLQRRLLQARAGLVFAAWLSGSAGHAQLAITEVMSSAATNLGPTLVVGKSDYWELTNFGTNTVSLDGYTFTDRDSDPGFRVGDPFRNCFIGPGESIIFLRTDTITNRQDFLNWWGASHLPPNLQVRTFPKKPGFDSQVDAVQIFDPSGHPVDRVDFGRAFRGHAFVYDPQTGEFGSFSALDVGGAFKAVQTDDVGSPGFTTGPVPLAIVEQPVATTQDAGLPASFSVRAAGLPRPSYQWFLEGTPIAGASQSQLILPNVQPSQAGNYTVRVSNGLNSLLSDPALLTVNTSPAPAVIVVPPAEANVFEGQTAVFSVQARGYPPPHYQWQTNGVNIPGATNDSFVVANAALALNGMIYSVRVQNQYATTNAGARLTVAKPPKLFITEVMASVAGGTLSGHTDWFELTNLDTNAVNLAGFRFSDRYSFDLCYTITNALSIEPGESVIFVERLTPAQFIEWWGKDRLPRGLKIITYAGLGLSSSGDVINFWNSAETDPYAPFVSAGFLESLPGVSLQFVAPDYYFVEDSVAGMAGAFHAANGDDVGSPGLVGNPPPWFLSLARDGEELVARCRVVAGKNYTLRTKLRLNDPYWGAVSTQASEETVLTIRFTPDNATQGFYILEELP